MKTQTMRPLAIDERSCPPELRAGLNEIRAEYPRRFAKGNRARRVRFVGGLRKTSGNLVVTKGSDGITVRYARKTDAFRALGRLLGENSPQEIVREFSETARFDLLGVMPDASRFTSLAST